MSNQFRKLQTGDYQTKQIQDNIERAIKEVIRAPILNGFQIDGIALSTAPTKVAHKLGRKPQGRMVVFQSNASTIYDVAWDDKFLTLIASGAVTVSLWVY